VFRIKRILSWNTSIDKLDELANFYTSVFEGREADGPITQNRGGGLSATIRRVDVGPLSVGLFQWSSGLRPDWDHHTYEVEWPGDAETVRSELQRMGVEIEGVRMHGDGPGYSITMRDPAGRRLEISTDPSDTIRQTE
jgi:hypothetical protein